MIEARRCGEAVDARIRNVRRFAATTENVSIALLAVAQSNATVGKIMAAQADVLGWWR